LSLWPIVELGVDSVSEFAEVVSRLQNRQPRPIPSTVRTVAKILADIERGGARAAARYARKFDAPGLKLKDLAVSQKELRAAQVPKPHQEAILTAIHRVTEFHEAQLKVLTKGWRRTKLWDDRAAWQWTIPAVRESDESRAAGPPPPQSRNTPRPQQPTSHKRGFVGQRLVPMDRVGIYVPGGKAAYPSSVIMNAVPAKVAGVNEIAMATPARTDGTLNPAILVAARELGIERIVRVGGAAAVGFLAFGAYESDSVRRQLEWLPCDKVVGPGNVWVNEAKRQLWGRVGLDSYAGPSEVCVVVDETAEARFAAADLLTQVEHSEDNVGILIGTDRAKVEEVLAEAESQLQGAPREKIMRRALSERGAAIVVHKLSEAALLASALAPEHLTLMVKDADEAARYVEDAGCILLGPWTPQSAGDFVSGPSHTIPTNLGARFASPVNVTEFLRFQSIGKLSPEDASELEPPVRAFGEMEGLPAHAFNAAIRKSRR